MIDVCPVGALTDKTFRFKNRVWFLNPVDAHCNCSTCCGKVTLWYRGDDVFRVTARKDEWGEVETLSNGEPAWICNACRFDKKKTENWTIEGPRKINRHSVITQGHYVGVKKPKETLTNVMHGRDPKLLMNIHDVSTINDPDIHLNEIDRAATSKVFK